MTDLVLAGGWGYNNLGDEAILAGYISHLGDHLDLEILTPDVARTRDAQLSSRHQYHAESDARRAPSKQAPLLLCGGGYLNGHWQPEITFKMRRLERARATRQMTTHAVEVRHLTDKRSTRRRAETLFAEAKVSVRDEKSVDEMRRLGVGAAEVVPDAISLLYPARHRYVIDQPELRGKVLLNLLDISQRADASEAEVDLSTWVDFCRRLVERLGDRAVGMIVGGGDYRFLRTLGPMNLIEPASATELVSAIAAADSILSVRMHPALIGSMMGTPTVSIPYCGKVRPTLSQIGLETLILTDLDARLALQRLEAPAEFDAQWSSAHATNKAWLSDALIGWP